MKKKGDGFLLIEFIISFAILTFAILLCAQFFSYIVMGYQKANMRLQALHMAQNSIEQLWFDNRSSHSKTMHNGIYTLERKKLNIPCYHQIDLQEVNVVYETIQVCKQEYNKTTVILSLPGYLYEAI